MSHNHDIRMRFWEIRYYNNAIFLQFALHSLQISYQINSHGFWFQNALTTRVISLYHDEGHKDITTSYARNSKTLHQQSF